jgi:hypothetical protein
MHFVKKYKVLYIGYHAITGERHMAYNSDYKIVVRGPLSFQDSTCR